MLFRSILIFGATEFLVQPSLAQDIWKTVDSSGPQHSPTVWESLSDVKRLNKSRSSWEIVPEHKERDQRSKIVIWEVLEPEDSPAIPPPENTSIYEVTPPSSLEEAEARLLTLPLVPSDFKPVLNLSHAVPTASILSQEEWRLVSGSISPLTNASGAENVNYSIQVDYGFSDKIQISGFYSNANDPLNAKIKGDDTRLKNFWESFGAAVRYRYLAKKNWSLALNSSLESWTVGSGGSDSLAQNSDNNTRANIFNNSGKRVETQNIIGSIALPLTWKTNNQLQFTVTPGISFLPSSQGEDQGGTGEFYGWNPYMSGGFLWYPIPEVGLSASIAQPIGNGANSFDKNLRFSRVPIWSGGVNWHFNPRIAFQGQLTNGFGVTPATALLTLPSDNRLGYSAKIIITPDAADTPQHPLNARQRSLSLGGLTVNTALIPPRANSIAKISSDLNGNVDATIEHSISNIFQVNLNRSKSNGIPQNSEHSRTYLNHNSVNWRVSGKAVLTSQLRGARIWSAFRISSGHNKDSTNTSGKRYLFAEAPFTWDINPNLAININPKAASSEVGTIWGLGISANINLSKGWELIPEANIVLNSQKENNCTLGLRWNATDDIAIEIYGSTASSTLDIGQLLNAEQIRWGSRLIIRL